MSLNEIKDNINIIDKKEKEELVRYVNELLLYEKRYSSKIHGLQYEIKYLKNQLVKIKDLINKIVETKVENIYNNDEWSLNDNKNGY
jgi:CII-binding regulator of phage lambda lysogenization HflD